jgi:putative transposase
MCELLGVSESGCFGEKRVEPLMRLGGLQGAHRRRRKGCTIRVPGVEPFADLVGRNFRPEAPNRVRRPTPSRSAPMRAGCTSPVQDLFSRRIVGWSMAAHMRQEFAVDTLEWRWRLASP